MAGSVIQIDVTAIGRTLTNNTHISALQFMAGATTCWWPTMPTTLYR